MYIRSAPRHMVAGGVEFFAFCRREPYWAFIVALLQYELPEWIAEGSCKIPRDLLAEPFQTPKNLDFLTILTTVGVERYHVMIM